jgi:uncharacterized protein YacL
MSAAIVQRVIGAAALMLACWQIGSLVGDGPDQPRNAMLGIGVGAVLGFVSAPIVVSRPYHALRRLVSKTPAHDLLIAILGLTIGLIVAALLSYPLSFLPWWFGHVLPGVAATVCAYLGVTFFLMKRRELASIISHRSTERAAERTGQPAERGCLLDTSAIIDGRVADISETGFISGPLLVPRFVLAELQHIAGSSDSLRRNRGRRGLEILNRLQKESSIAVKVCDLEARDVPDVDGKLVKLAREMDCPVITNDFNLNRVAELQGVRVLNINQLANAIKPVVLPGEEMEVRIIQEGKELNQGVGYLDDGTMIVVENGRRYLHNDIAIVVTRVLQTVAGRMIFAHPKSNGRE